MVKLDPLSSRERQRGRKIEPITPLGATQAHISCIPISPRGDPSGTSSVIYTQSDSHVKDRPKLELPHDLAAVYFDGRIYCSFYLYSTLAYQHSGLACFCSQAQLLLLELDLGYSLQLFGARPPQL